MLFSLVVWFGYAFYFSFLKLKKVKILIKKKQDLF